MKKNILYMGIAILIGLLGGYVLFGGKTKNTAQETFDKHNHIESTDRQMWTCSMHPQIMQPEAGDCPICGMDLIRAESSAEGLAMNEIKMTTNAIALANIQTSIVGNTGESNEDKMTSLSGKITANEENNAIQASYFDGRIEQLNVNYEGQKVNRGALLATLYAPNLVAAQQELITAAFFKESQPALYNAVRNKLKNWKLSDKQIDAIETSGNVRDNFPIYATVFGTVVQVLAKEGDYVKEGQPILTLSNLNSVWAEFDAYENQISNIKEGQKIKIATNAYPSKEFHATVSFIDPILNTSTRTVTVRATLKNSEGLFKPGMFVSGKLKGVTEKNSELISVPATAVLWTGERSLVYVKTNVNEPIFEMREIVIANRNGEHYFIKEGLENGDEIVTYGTFSVDAAAQLQGKKSMMNKGKKEVAAMPLSQKINLSASFQKDFKKVLDTYLQMKDAFVSSDAVQVSTFAQTTSKSLKPITTKGLGTIEQAHLNKIIEMLDAIAANNALEKQRDHFVILNEYLVPIAMNMESSDQMLYVQKCPMANSNKGASWLSAEKDIKNPYYGDAMLTCGSVIEEIK